VSASETGVYRSAERPNWWANESLPETERAMTLPVGTDYRHVGEDAAHGVVYLLDQNGTAIEFVPLLALKEIRAHIVDHRNGYDDDTIEQVDLILHQYGVGA
jgi:hypothetical protein